MLRESYKTTVLLDEVVKFLNIIPDGVYIDGTFGQGGHSRVILSFLSSQGRLLAIDQDYFSVRIGKIFEKEDTRFTMIHGRFSRLFQYIRHRKLLGKINGIVLDLGLSRLQLENPSRGFSFIHNGPLDMRMDTSSSLSADMWLSKASLEKIVWVLQTYGEEKFAKRISKAIIMYRKKNKLKYTRELVQLIINAIPWCDRYKHPATRTFQAVRIYINNELEEIRSVLKDSLFALAPGGRLLVISFHSLEDRIVKSFIRRYSLPSSVLDMNSFGDCNTHYDCKEIIRIKNMNINYGKFYLRSIKKVFPSKSEIVANICARSAILRCVEKVMV